MCGSGQEPTALLSIASTSAAPESAQAAIGMAMSNPDGTRVYRSHSPPTAAA